MLKLKTCLVYSFQRFIGGMRKKGRKKNSQVFHWVRYPSWRVTTDHAMGSQKFSSKSVLPLKRDRLLRGRLEPPSSSTHGCWGLPSEYTSWGTGVRSAAENIWTKHGSCEVLLCTLQLLPRRRIFNASIKSIFVSRTDISSCVYVSIMKWKKPIPPH